MSTLGLAGKVRTSTTPTATVSSPKKIKILVRVRTVRSASVLVGRAQGGSSHGSARREVHGHVCELTT
jgi:hypothetical protein